MPTSLAIHEIRSFTGRVYLLDGEEGVVAVDALTTRHRRRVLSSLGKTLSRTGKKLRLILLTHSHIDHFSGALEMRNLFGAPIAIHELDVDWLRHGLNCPLYSRNLPESALKLLVSRMKAEPVEPDIILKGDEGDLGEYGLDAKWLRTPGHTDGSISVVFPGETAIVGDLVIGRFGFSRNPAYPFWVKDVGQLKQSIKRVLDLSPQFLLSGHGGPFKAGDVRRVFLE